MLADAEVTEEDVDPLWDKIMERRTVIETVELARRIKILEDIAKQKSNY
jgi:hypothetical protein